MKKFLYWFSIVPLTTIIPLATIGYFYLFGWLITETNNVGIATLVATFGIILLSILIYFDIRLIKRITREMPRTYWLLFFTINSLAIAFSIYLTYLGFTRSAGWLCLAVPMIHLAVFLVFYITFNLKSVPLIYTGIELAVSFILFTFTDISWKYTAPWFWIPFIGIFIQAGIQGGLHEPNFAKTSTEKDASVVKRGVVGYIVAGPAGAIIGAISAADKNNRNKK